MSTGVGGLEDRGEVGKDRGMGVVWGKVRSQGHTSHGGQAVA